MAENEKLGTRARTLHVVGGWRLEVRGWKVEVGSWKLGRKAGTHKV
jgi:hypothetical protein